MFPTEFCFFFHFAGSPVFFFFLFLSRPQRPESTSDFSSSSSCRMITIDDAQCWIFPARPSDPTKDSATKLSRMWLYNREEELWRVKWNFSQVPHKRNFGAKPINRHRRTQSSIIAPQIVFFSFSVCVCVLRTQMQHARWSLQPSLLNFLL